MLAFKACQCLLSQGSEWLAVTHRIYFRIVEFTKSFREPFYLLLRVLPRLLQ
jgi:hypothetical protein